MKLGELILAHGGPIALEPFSAKHLSDPLPALGWLGQAIMAAVRLEGGWDVLRAFDALCWSSGFFAIAMACRWRGASAGGVAIAIILAVIAALPTASIRPQSFALLCFGLLLALLRLDPRPAIKLAFGVPLLLLWQNLHPSVSLAGLALGCHALAGWWCWWRDGKSAAPWAETALAVFAGLAMFATPDGWSILAISAANADMSVAIGVSEWLPLWHPGNWTNAMAMLALVLTGILFVWRAGSERIDLGEGLLALALAGATMFAYRFAAFWAPAMIPVISRSLTRAASPPGREKAGRLGIGAACVIAVLGLSPRIIPTHFDATLPVSAVAALKKQDVRGTVYADFPYGGILIDAGWPRWKVAYDGRYYRYERDEWRYNGGIETGIVPLRDVVHKWHPAAFLLNRHHNAPLARSLARSPDWRLVFRDAQTVVYVPH